MYEDEVGEAVDKKNHILTTVSDLVADFLYYSRKEDEELPVGEIEKAIQEGLITEDEIVEQFRAKLKEGLNK